MPGETGTRPSLEYSPHLRVLWGRASARLSSLFNESLESLCAVLFPGDCAVCSQPLEEMNRLPAGLRAGCWGGLRRYEGPACVDCGRPFPSSIPLTASKPLCGLCRRDTFFFRKARSFGLYEGVLRQVILLVKFQRHERLGRRLGEKLMDTLTQEEELLKSTRIVPVLLHRRRRRERGFNQAEILARGLTDRTGIPMDRDSLRRTRFTPPQTGLSPSARRANVRGAFDVRGTLLRGHIVLLVDDVITTGATVNACARRLKQAGPSRF